MKGFGGGLLGFNPTQLMAEGYGGSPGMPIYTQNRKNPLQMDMSGWSAGAMDSPRGMRPVPTQIPYLGPPINSMAAPSSSPLSAFTKAGSIPALPGGSGYPGLPVDPYAPGGSAPPPAPLPMPSPGSPSPGSPSPGAPSSPSPSSPVNPGLGPSAWGPSGPGNYPGGNPNAGNSPSNSAPYQPGQIGWGQLGPNNYTPMFNDAAQRYIQNALYQNYGGVPAPWLSQVDPNNYLSSIGQLSGTPFNPANWGG